MLLCRVFGKAGYCEGEIPLDASRANHPRENCEQSANPEVPRRNASLFRRGAQIATHPSACETRTGILGEGDHGFLPTTEEAKSQSWR